jgi:hypothetical protein
MKTKYSVRILVILICVIALSFRESKLYCQVIETLKTFTLPEQTYKGVLIAFEYNATAGNYIVTYAVGSKKQPRFESLVFDKDFNFLNAETPVDMSFADAALKYPYYDFDKGDVITKTRKKTEGEITPNDTSAIIYNYSITKEVFKLSKKNKGTVVFEKSIPFKEFETKFKFSPSGEKGKPCNEKNNKYIVASHFVDSVGNVFILGQNKDKQGALGVMQAMQQGKADTKYRDCFIFHFDPSGNLVSQYSYDTKWATSDSPCEQYLIRGSSMTNYYWIILPTFYDTMFGSDYFQYYKPDICKIDIGNNTMGDFLKGQEQFNIKEFKFLDPLYPFITPERGTLVLLGKDKPRKSGKMISFVRIKVE